MQELEIISQGIYEDLRQRILYVQQKVQKAVNAGMVQIYWEVGQRVDNACDGKRADYGKEILKYLSIKLTNEFGKAYSLRNLQMMRQFFRAFPNANTLCSQLSWSHYKLLMRVNNIDARNYYEKECAAAGWSTRELERQITTFAYQRTVSNQNTEEKLPQLTQKESVANNMPPYKDFIRDPYVLEFLELKSSPEFYEKDIEQGIIEHLQKFLLELGRGFSFVARQKHIDIDGDHFYIDLVFYNYILKCFVLIDLKLGKVKHQDMGQMQMYVNYYKHNMKLEGDNDPIGIVLCAEKNDAVVKYTLGDESQTQIYASKYLSYMPTEEELRRELNFQALLEQSKE
ncbi:YhcG family protein [uncultured Anaerovibrio sp.]|uniref:PDDEXK nuclease domain-containing protein n=1 Tax=uncultured Anaerovibrio sp. TaxID=361586 RepID=UPI002635F9EA|nr:PDDEXK nuclease domain-containing protein [uncultured Anaerovibrio sp.]